MSKNKNNDDGWIWVILAIVFIILIIGYVLSFGKGALPKKRQLNTLNEPLHFAKIRHRKLLELIEKKSNLSERLHRIFRRAYFFTRVILSLLFLGYNALLYFVLGIKDVGNILNWNEVILILFALMSFITFGSLTNVRLFVSNLKLRLENFVFGKYIDIDDEILVHEKEEIVLRQKIEKEDSSK